MWGEQVLARGTAPSHWEIFRHDPKNEADRVGPAVVPPRTTAGPPYSREGQTGVRRKIVLLDLKVEVPELEPSSVLLEQLSQLSQLSVASTGTGSRGKRAVVAAASVTVIAGASWLTGTMPGVASPFSRGPGHGHAQHGPAEHAPGTPSDESAVPYLSGTLPPGQAKPHRHGKGNHTGQTKPHHDNGNHTGQTKPHLNNGNHTGQTKPHLNNGNHTGQTKPHHTGAQSGQSTGQSTGQGGGQGSGHRT